MRNEHSSNKMSSGLQNAGQWLHFLFLIIIGGVIGLAIYGVKTWVDALKNPQEIVLENSPIAIESVRPKGELYVSSAIVEDYVTLHRTEKHLGLIPEEHSCVQILKQKVSFKIDLDKIVYTPDTLNRLIVTLPDVEYVASTQNTPFMSDDEDFWEKELPSTNGLKRKVEQKIRKRYDTVENRKRANKYAEEAVTAMLMQMGYEVRFTPKIEQTKEGLIGQ